MKKLFLFLMLVMFTTMSSFAQSQTKADVPEPKSKAIQFMTANGSLLVKEFYDLKKIKGVKCQVLILSNIATGEKNGCLRLETEYSNESYIGTLDSDELDACIQSLGYIKDTLLPSAPTVYTEAAYTTNDDVKIGAYYSKNKWTVSIYTKAYTYYSAEFLDAGSIDSFISVMQQAKAMIAEKTAQ